MEQTEQEPTLQKKSSHLAKILVILLILSLSIAGLSIYVAYNALQKVQKLESQITTTSAPAAERQTPDIADPQTGDQKNLKTFTDPNIKGMTFQYDPTQWEPIVMTGQDQEFIDETDIRGVGVYLKEKSSSGHLLFSYTLEFGMGGGYTPFESSEITQVTNVLSRMRSSGKYEYGLNNELVYFSSKPEEKEKMIGYCEEMMQPNYEGMTVFDTKECEDINSGKIIGYAPQPTFTWSLRQNILTSLKEVNPQWEGDSYVQSEGLDKGYVIVGTSYEGDNPKAADEIVKQLKF